jgi:hypothetical protein
MKKKEIRKPICGQCMEPIPPGEVLNAFWAGYEYRHSCGRVIVKGSGNAEVLQAGTYLDPSNPKHGFTREGDE